MLLWVEGSSSQFEKKTSEGRYLGIQCIGLLLESTELTRFDYVPVTIHTMMQIWQTSQTDTNKLQKQRSNSYNKKLFTGR